MGLHVPCAGAGDGLRLEEYVMRRTISGTIILAVIAGITATGSPTHAQSLRRILDRAVERTIEGRNNDVSPPRRNGARTVPPAVMAGQATGAGDNNAGMEPAPPGVEPWPVNAGDAGVTRPSQLAFSADLMARRQRFLEASRFACSTCEGSQDSDSWRKAFGHPNETYSSWSAILETWTVGRSISWRGTAHDGLITVVGETPVGGFRCRQLRHRITTRGRNPVSTERPGLICLGKRDAYSARETWHEVF